ncbi:MAG TPA: O-antigen ligase family protein [Solirubrobacteraceae bacterium]|nr:O-antigen ligase family protein [Solirubrobacteraceae bacterium]
MSAAAASADAFPRTRRPLPWALAAFMALLYLAPVDSTEVKIHLPVGSQIDRFAVVAILLLWVLHGGDRRAFMRTRRSRLFVGAAFAFLALAIASLLLDAPLIVNVSELTLAEKRFALLGSFLVLGWFTLTALRYVDLPGFIGYMIGLGSLTALGVLFERHTGYNPFYELSRALLAPVATVAPSPTDIHPALGSDGRVTVVGPTIHGLALTTMMAVLMPFALVRMLDATSRRQWWCNGIAFVLMLAAGASTDRKSALVVPAAVVLFVAWHRRRQMLRLAPLGAVLLVAMVHLASPGALGTLFSSETLTSSSTSHRLGDLTNVMPDILAHPLLGRGYGTLDPEQPRVFRINDNEYIDEIWEDGVAGLIAYLFMILAPIILARRAISGGDALRSSLALAGAAGCVAYLVVNALFDAMSFPQAPYMFFTVAALTTIAAAGAAGDQLLPARTARAHGPIVEGQLLAGSQVPGV